MILIHWQVRVLEVGTLEQAGVGAGRPATLEEADLHQNAVLRNCLRSSLNETGAGHTDSPSVWQLGQVVLVPLLLLHLSEAHRVKTPGGWQALLLQAWLVVVVVLADLTEEEDALHALLAHLEGITKNTLKSPITPSSS
nr:hypothetical protein BaRGS_014314 [Batillaria attramentaria]